MLIFSGILAWITLGLFIILLLKIVIRILAMKFERFRKINKFLSKTHKPLGFAILVTSLIHGFTSSVFVFSFNLGTLTFISFILLLLSYFFKNYYKPQFLLIHRILSFITMILLLYHLVDVGGFKLPSRFHNNPTYSETQYIFKDGKYQGIGNGLKGEIKVSIEIVNHEIKDIIILDSKDTKAYVEKMEQELKTKIIEKNSLVGVDTVTGATSISKGYLEAINTALEKAK